MRDQVQSGWSANEGLEVEVSLQYREVVKGMRVLPREDRLQAHPDCWYLQDNYYIRARK